MAHSLCISVRDSCYLWLTMSQAFWVSVWNSLYLSEKMLHLLLLLYEIGFRVDLIASMQLTTCWPKKKTTCCFFFLVKQTFITLEEFIPQLGVWLQPKRKLILPLHQPLHYLLLCLVFAIDFDVTSLDFFFCWRFERLPLATSKTCLLCHILHFSVNVITSLSWWLLVVVPMSFHLGFIIPKIYVKGLHESSFEKSNTRVFKKLNWIY